MIKRNESIKVRELRFKVRDWVKRNPWNPPRLYPVEAGYTQKEVEQNYFEECIMTCIKGMTEFDLESCEIQIKEVLAENCTEMDDHTEPKHTCPKCQDMLDAIMLVVRKWMVKI